MEWKTAFIIMTAFVLLLMSAAYARKYARVIYRLMVYSVLGTVIILLANIILDRVGIHIAINPATVLAVGILKIPGALLLVVLNYYFV